MFIASKNWLSLPLLGFAFLLMSPVSLAAGYDDDAVEVEMARSGKDKGAARKNIRESFRKRNSKNDSSDNDRFSRRSGRDDSRSSRGRSRSRSRSRSSRPQGPPNERFGKTTGKVRFVLVDDPTKTTREQDLKNLESLNVKPKKIRLGPETSKSDINLPKGPNQ